jgi:hypothetical protein
MLQNESSSFSFRAATTSSRRSPNKCARVRLKRTEIDGPAGDGESSRSPLAPPPAFEMCVTMRAGAGHDSR